MLIIIKKTWLNNNLQANWIKNIKLHFLQDFYMKQLIILNILKRMAYTP